MKTILKTLIDTFLIILGTIGWLTLLTYMTYTYPIITISSVLLFFISHLIGKSGSSREIGYRISFLCSILFTPLIGLLLVISSKQK